MTLLIDRFLPWGKNKLASVDSNQPSIRLTLLSNGNLQLELQAPWYGNAAPPLPVGSLWGLWEYEVVEVFIAGHAGQYLEVELNPYGHFLVLSLSAPRVIEHKHLELEGLLIERHIDPATGSIYGRWSAQAVIPSQLLPSPVVHSKEPCWGINAFWCFNQDTRSFYVASSLPGQQPDFHQPHYFPLYPLAQIAAPALISMTSSSERDMS